MKHNYALGDFVMYSPGASSFTGIVIATVTAKYLCYTELGYVIKRTVGGNQYVPEIAIDNYCNASDKSIYEKLK